MQCIPRSIKTENDDNEYNNSSHRGLEEQSRELAASHSTLIQPVAGIGPHSSRLDGTAASIPLSRSFGASMVGVGNTRVTIGRRGRVLTHPLSCAFAVQPGVAIEYWRLSASRWQHAHAADVGPQLQRKVWTANSGRFLRHATRGRAPGRVGVFRSHSAVLASAKGGRASLPTSTPRAIRAASSTCRSTGNPRARARSRECRRGPCNSAMAASPRLFPHRPRRPPFP